MEKERRFISIEYLCASPTYAVISCDPQNLRKYLLIPFIEEEINNEIKELIQGHTVENCRTSVELALFAENLYFPYQSM